MPDEGIFCGSEERKPRHTLLYGKAFVTKLLREKDRVWRAILLWWGIFRGSLKYLGGYTNMKTSSIASYTIFRGALLLFSLLLACANSKEKEQGKGSDEVTLTMYVQSTAPSPLGESEIDEKIREITGYKIERRFLVADQATTSGIMLASGEYPDILNMKEDTQKFVDAGVYIPLQDLIRKNAPNIYRIFEPYWAQIKAPDGNIYTIPQGIPFNPTRKGLANNGAGIGMYIQKAVLEWAGYPQIKTVAEYFDLLKRYKEEFPTIDGEDTIGFGFPAEGWRFGYTIYSASFLNGYPNESGPLIDCVVAGKADKTNASCPGKWVPRDPFYQSQEFHDVMKIYNQAYLDGLIPKEMVVQTHEQYNAKIASGRVLGVFDQGWEINKAFDVLKKEKPDRLLVNLPITLQKDQKIYVGVATPNYGFGYGISTQAADPVAAIKYLDATISNEVITLVNWGIEGQDYLVDKEGRFYRTDEMRANASDKKYKDRHWGNVKTVQWSAQGMFDDGNAISPGTQPREFFAALSRPEKEVAKAYGLQSLAELFPPPTDRRISFSPLWTFRFDKDQYKDFLEVKADRDKLTSEYVAKLIFAERDSFDSVWREYNKKLANIKNSSIWLPTWKTRLGERIASWNQ